MIMERAEQIREIDSRKSLMRDLLALQRASKSDEVETQKEIDKENNRLKRLVSGDGNQKEKKSIKEICPRLEPAIEIEDNIRQDPNDIELARQQLELERTREKQAEKSQMPEVKTFSVPTVEPQTGAGIKRSTSEPVTPSTAKEDIEPPKKKSKSNSGAAVGVLTSPKSKQQEKCTECRFPEPSGRFWATDPKTGSRYCYGCHVHKRNLCKHKPETGGKACFRKKEKDDLCSEHKYTAQTSRMDLKKNV